ncbi:hypothetical protein [Kribbella sp. NPDC051770]|uniref:hypothetical protein n=1 Tax=Kribbella sp. NPDC051770 TaxID=3155413 RepID=UPI00343A4A2E
MLRGLVVTTAAFTLAAAPVAAAAPVTAADNSGCDTDFPYILCVETVSKGGDVNAVRARFQNNWASSTIVAHVELSSGGWRFSTSDKTYELNFLKPREITEYFYPEKYTPTKVCGTLWQKTAPGSYKRLVTTCIWPDD